jgi:hypothetical protein
MIRVRMRKSNPLDAAVGGASNGLEVRRISWPWVDHPVLDDVAVRAVER